jgi:hypothetical protein
MVNEFRAEAPAWVNTNASHWHMVAIQGTIATAAAIR